MAFGRGCEHSPSWTYRGRPSLSTCYRRFTGFVWVWRSNKDTEFHLSKGRVSGTHVTDCTLSAAIACGLVNGPASNSSPPYFFLETNRYRSTPEAVHKGGHIHAPSRRSARLPHQGRSRPVKSYPPCGFNICILYPGTSDCHQDPKRSRTILGAPPW